MVKLINSFRKVLIRFDLFLYIYWRPFVAKLYSPINTIQKQLSPSISKSDNQNDEMCRHFCGSSPYLCHLTLFSNYIKLFSIIGMRKIFLNGRNFRGKFVSRRTFSKISRELFSLLMMVGLRMRSEDVELPTFPPLFGHCQGSFSKSIWNDF